MERSKLFKTSLAALFVIYGFAGLWLALVWMSVPSAPAVVLALAVGGLLVWADRFAPTLTATSVLILLGGLELGLRSLDHQPAYYRPHEMLALNNLHYKPNQSLENFQMPYGGVYILSRRSEYSIVTPRDISFYTDDFGYRNRHGYQGQKWIILGDSFIAGTGLSQEDIMSEALSKALGEGVYGVGYPGSPEFYLTNYNRLKNDFHPEARAIWFIFEGNDFDCFGPGGSKTKSVPFYMDKPNWIRDKAVYRTMYGLIRNAFDGLFRIGPEDSVLVKSVGGQDFGFWRLYETITKRETDCGMQPFYESFPDHPDPTALVVFIPTKYRVFHPFIQKPGEPDLPNLQFSFLAQGLAEREIPLLDLTPILRAEQKRLMADGGYTFWPDDTHWSPAGVRVSAEAIAEKLKSLEKP